MDFRELTKLLFKICGALILVQTVSWLPGHVAQTMAILKTSFWGFIGASLLPSILPVSAGFALLWFPGTIANKLVPVPDTQSVPSSGALERVLVSLLGLYLLFRAASDVVFGLVRFYTQRLTWLEQSPNTPLPWSFLADTYGNLLGIGIEFAIALYLMLGARGIQSVLEKMRGR